MTKRETLDRIRNLGMTTFYFLRIDGRVSMFFQTKRAAVTMARRHHRKHPDARISLWFRDVIGQEFPENWRRNTLRDAIAYDDRMSGQENAR